MLIKKPPSLVPVRHSAPRPPGFKPICGLCSAIQHLLRGQVTQEGRPLHGAAASFETWVARMGGSDEARIHRYES